MDRAFLLPGCPSLHPIDPHPAVIEKLLKNPYITEQEVIVIASRRPNTPEVLREIVISDKWLSRPVVRKALVHNPYGSPGVSIKLMTLAPEQELLSCRHASYLHPLVPEASNVFLVKRGYPLDY